MNAMLIKYKERILVNIIYKLICWGSDEVEYKYRVRILKLEGYSFKINLVKYLGTADWPFK